MIRVHVFPMLWNSVTEFTGLKGGEVGLWARVSVFLHLYHQPGFGENNKKTLSRLTVLMCSQYRGI